MKKLIIIAAFASLFGACNNSAKQEEAEATAKQEVIDSINQANAIRQQTIDSIQREEEIKHRYATHHSSSPQSEQTSTTENKKKGLNNTAKGALIGAGAGAVGGALIDKKHGEGAIVGGLIGAGAGAISGAIIDKQKKKKEEEQKKSSDQ